MACTHSGQSVRHKDKDENFKGPFTHVISWTIPIATGSGVFSVFRIGTEMAKMGTEKSFLNYSYSSIQNM